MAVYGRFRAVTIAGGLARIVATREFAEPFGFFGQEQLARWSPQPRQTSVRIIAPPRLLRADAPSLSILRRVMSGEVAFTAGRLAKAPHGLFVRSDALFRCAECIMHRVFWVYRCKARKTQVEFMAAASIRIAASPSIFDAASNGDCSLVQDYLALDPSCVHSREEGSDQTPLHKSARNGHADLCQMLVLAGCNVNAKSALNIDRTPLHDAALKGCVNVCTLLVNAGAVVDAKDSGNSTPLHVSALKGHYDVCQFLVQARADVVAQDHVHRTPLHCAAAEGHVDVCQFLVQAGASVDANDDFQATPLHNAALHGRVSVCAFLVHASANISARTSDGRTPLDWAAYSEEQEVVQFLGRLDVPK